MQWVDWLLQVSWFGWTLLLLFGCWLIYRGLSHRPAGTPIVRGLRWGILENVNPLGRLLYGMGVLAVIVSLGALAGQAYDTWAF